MHVWIEDGLTPCAGIGCHDRSDNVDKLCEAGNLHTVCVAQECDQHASDEKCILKVVNILKLMRCTYPFFQFLILFVAVIPYVPLIEGEVDLFLAVFFRFDCIADCNYTGDEIIHTLGACQKIKRIICIISVILV